MKKLGKKTDLNEITIEAYARTNCSCTCLCWGCSCSTNPYLSSNYSANEKSTQKSQFHNGTSSKHIK